MREITIREALNEALQEEMKRDDAVILFGEDIARMQGAFKVTAGLLDMFGEDRVIDTPLAETLVVGGAVGMAMAGLRPVAELMFADFLGIAMDQLCNYAAKMKYNCGVNVPLVVRTACGARGSGMHHSQNTEGWIQNVPGLKIVMPSTAYDAKGLLKSAIRDNNPVVFFEQKTMYGLKGEVPEGGDLVIPLGKADVKRQGGDITIIATGGTVHEALAAAAELEGRGISCEVVDPRTLLPLDHETIIESVKKTHNVVIVHEAPKIGGIGAEIAAVIAEEAIYELESPVRRIGAPFTPVPFSRPLEKAYVPDRERIITTVMELLSPEGV
ncbi:MAG: alpha-ketoacid dehydrogenase subunit beta [Spirochaetales bacterium]|nr:alpha-ketoacid dehydrogenase subunit beta [Spirochaetales bacterium]